MIGRLNHIALVVPDLEKASRFYQDTMGASVTASLHLPDHGVSVVFVELPNTRVELLHPLGDDSPIRSFLTDHPEGGMHHMCYEVRDLLAVSRHLKAQGMRILGSGEPKTGAHGKPVLFLHPKDAFGTLIELEQA
ncbi:methylmalonyl-CoA epimerase [Haematospirillum sp. H1815]|uniref:methylmalonyl-CoA epimerase n=1 Tax=Haematospirillum sp. H1815 TaxID=2723108 RepID=UPI00143928D2|nr:methylmalonyl-CoA epimerase [Haematospirillum sp. H1815]NKD76496.1 methylmalonyl-CoA epimerase [Haematospirillum sp. H1815]